MDIAIPSGGIGGGSIPPGGTFSEGIHPLHDKDKSIIQIIRYLIAGATITVLQFILVNVFPLMFSSWQSPLPSFLSGIFSEGIMGEGNSNWGYVMTFLLSNLIANVYGYFINRKAVFNSDSPGYCFVIFFAVITSLIIFSTWLQGVISNRIAGSGALCMHKWANTIAAAAAAFMQNIIVFPLEKFVLLRERKSPPQNKESH